VTERGFGLVTGNNPSDDDDDSAEDMLVIKARYDIGDDDPFQFPNFDVVQSPPDHHYLDTK
jgi:ubiquitin-conjugating enzyme E2 O